MNDKTNAPIAAAIATNIIKEFEGCKLTSYRCPAGRLTIGYGHTGQDVTEGLTISEDEANKLLLTDLERFDAGVLDMVTAPISPRQKAALISFAYNVGLEALRKSTLLQMVNDGYHAAAAEQFLKWTRAGGKVLAGLERRRKAEADMYVAGTEA